MKRFLALLIIGVTLASTLAFADDSKISPELRANPSTQKVQVIVQYAPGTQINCSGLLGLVGCLVNDITKLGGSILGQLPLVNGVVALLDGNGISEPLQSVERRLHQHRPAVNSHAQQRRLGHQCRIRLAVELHRRRSRHRSDRQRRQHQPRSLSGHSALVASRVSAVLRSRKFQRR